MLFQDERGYLSLEHMTQSRKLREALSASPAFPGLFGVFFCASGTGRITTSPAFGTTGSRLFTTSGAISVGAAAKSKGRSRNQSCNAKASQDFLEIVSIHNRLLVFRRLL